MPLKSILSLERARTKEIIDLPVMDRQEINPYPYARLEFLTKEIRIHNEGRIVSSINGIGKMIFPCKRMKLGLLWQLSGKESACQWRRHGFDP